MAAELSPQIQNFPVVAERATGRCRLGPAFRRAASAPHVRLHHLGKGVLGQVALPGLHARKSVTEVIGRWAGDLYLKNNNIPLVFWMHIEVGKVQRKTKKDTEMGVPRGGVRMFPRTPAIKERSYSTRT